MSWTKLTVLVILLWVLFLVIVFAVLFLITDQITSVSQKRPTTCTCDDPLFYAESFRYNRVDGGYEFYGVASDESQASLYSVCSQSSYFAVMAEDFFSQEIPAGITSRPIWLYPSIELCVRGQDEQGATYHSVGYVYLSTELEP